LIFKFNQKNNLRDFNLIYIQNLFSKINKITFYVLIDSYLSELMPYDPAHKIRTWQRSIFVSG